MLFSPAAAKEGGAEQTEKRRWAVLRNLKEWQQVAVIFAGELAVVGLAVLVALVPASRPIVAGVVALVAAIIWRLMVRPWLAGRRGS